ncbi:helix-turn-helix domain-containing protein [Candidatus Poribacteria bacterium]|nr:helix-turn-helix domain-containing protein [Candidatus Poribacteria bacterium]
MEKDRRKDNLMLKTHKIALNPNNVQSTQLVRHCGYTRVAYNHALSVQRRFRCRSMA